MPTNPTLNLSYARSTDRTYITVTDNTGLYNITTNPYGYGGVNVAVGAYTNFNITVTLPDPDTLLPAGTPVVVNAYPSLPSSANGTFDLTSLALVGTADTTLIDGVYLFEVAAAWTDGDTGETTTENYKAYYEIVECCVNNLIVESVGCGCSGSSKKYQTLAKAVVNLYALSPKVVAGVVTASPIEACNQWDKAATAILELQDICDNENCGGCNGCN
jgi:hypothetical protein